MQMACKQIVVSKRLLLLTGRPWKRWLLLYTPKRCLIDISCSSIRAPVFVFFFAFPITLLLVILNIKRDNIQTYVDTFKVDIYSRTVLAHNPKISLVFGRHPDFYLLPINVVYSSIQSRRVEGFTRLATCR